MPIGIFGGTFDPIHHGHLDAARAVQHAFALDRVLFVPAHVPPHRLRSPHASGHHRFAMTALATLEEPGFEVSDLELERPGPSYTADTLSRLARDGWTPWQLFFITGVDAFAEIATWHRYPELLDLAHFVVVTRPGYDQRALRHRLPELEGRFQDAGPAGAGPHRRGAGLPPGRGKQPVIYLLDARTSDASSTEIRRRLAAGEPIEGLVPPSVERYIRRHRLYEPLPEAAHLHGQA
jgi:nicotinate-nucleotide adenylyltransferase